MELGLEGTVCGALIRAELIENDKLRPLKRMAVADDEDPKEVATTSGRWV